MTYAALFLAAAIGAFILLQLLVLLPSNTLAKNVVFVAYLVLGIATGLPISRVIADEKKVKEVMKELGVRKLDQDLTKKHGTFASNYTWIVNVPYMQEILFIVVAGFLVLVGTVIYLS